MADAARSDHTLTLEEAARECRCSVRRIRLALATNELPSVKLGRSRVIPREAFFSRLNELALVTAAPAPPPPRKQGRRRPLPTIQGTP